ncbi:hypothetical protein D778_02642 [Xanthomarina gelatinilytica]|uniref:Uncharacterized protein n=1 Tax=Xanthomarina gelatinilytica TaxID=1137281 RepID=M7MKD3_9FLAO|nr:hypothetical protein [Xanthomarina gelatinilytica]EMQ95340.1 hypothetical protein D778_02642 [Xanthomarina gelatinilytica]
MEPADLIQTVAKTETLQSQLSHILDAFQQMDYHKLNTVLDDRYYEEMPKTAFIYRQQRIFKFMQSKGDTHLKLSTNICTGCLCGKPVFVFTGNHSGLTYGVYVEFLNDAIVDVFRCSEQSSSSFGLMPF